MLTELRKLAAGRAADCCRARAALLGHQQERTEMTKYKLEYIWLDGYKPVPNLRGKNTA